MWCSKVHKANFNFHVFYTIIRCMTGVIQYLCNFVESKSSLIKIMSKDINCIMLVSVNVAVLIG